MVSTGAIETHRSSGQATRAAGGVSVEIIQIYLLILPNTPCQSAIGKLFRIPHNPEDGTIALVQQLHREHTKEISGFPRFIRKVSLFQKLAVAVADIKDRTLDLLNLTYPCEVEIIDIVHSAILTTAFTNTKGLRASPGLVAALRPLLALPDTSTTAPRQKVLVVAYTTSHARVLAAFVFLAFACLMAGIIAGVRTKSAELGLAVSGGTFTLLALLQAIVKAALE